MKKLFVDVLTTLFDSKLGLKKRKEWSTYYKLAEPLNLESYFYLETFVVFDIVLFVSAPVMFLRDGFVDNLICANFALREIYVLNNFNMLHFNFVTIQD